MRLPTYQQLTEEQVTIINLPFDKNWVVTGPPGTGKTILALWKVKDLIDLDEEDVQFIVFNRVLKDYATSAFKDAQSGLSLTNPQERDLVATYHETIHALWKQAELPGRPPKVGKIHFDWTQMLAPFVEHQPRTAKHVIIDEGQDLPQTFYIFSRLTCDHITVFADPYQTIQSEIDHATTESIQDSVTAAGSYKVTQNHRNSVPIAKLSHHYFTGTSEQLPTLPDSEESASDSLREHQTEGYEASTPEIVNREDWKESMKYIANYAEINEDQSIGIFSPYTSWAERWEVELKRHLSQGRRQKVHLQVWKKDNVPPKRADFERIENGGILITTPASLKGLEFDAVFVPEMHNKAWKDLLDRPLGRQKFYVMITRARTTLEFLYSGSAGDPPSLFQEVPDELLKRPDPENDTPAAYSTNDEWRRKWIGDDDDEDVF